MSVQILYGHALDRLRELPDESVHCAVSSPPYWRQRNYHIAGQLGLEHTPEEYIDNITAVFREVRRVLRSDGTCWVNIGDKWASGGHGGGGSYMQDRGEAWAHAKDAKGWRSPPTGYKDKDLVGVPWMLAFAMRNEGWYLRQCNIWGKPNCMPESVTDRSTASHEYVFHFAKNNDYFYDAEAARTPPPPQSDTELARNSIEARKDRANADAKSAPTAERNGIRRSDKQRGHTRKHEGFNDRWDAMERSEQMAGGANLRSVWWISPAQYREGHFAVMPSLLAEICIRAGTSAHGVCAQCGKPWERITEKGAADVEHQRACGGDAAGEYHGEAVKDYEGAGVQNASAVKARVLAGMADRITLGWQRTCECDAGVVPATVLDPFGGAGTTGLVADRLGRNAILIELNPDYVALARQRVIADAPLLAEVR